MSGSGRSTGVRLRDGTAKSRIVTGDVTRADQEFVFRGLDEPVMLMRKLFGRKARDNGRLGEWLKSGIVGLLLFSVVASSIAGAGTALSCTVIVVWALFPALVGARNAARGRVHIHADLARGRGRRGPRPSWSRRAPAVKRG